DKSREQSEKSRGEGFAAARAAMGDRATQAPGAGGGLGRGGRRPQHAGTLWYLDEKGILKSERVRTGISDGQKTEVSGKELKEGSQVIVGATQTAQTGAGLFQPSMPGPGPRR